MQGKVPKRIATAILNSLKGGVVPRVGLGYIAVGREAEISALLTDIDIIEDGGAAFRFIVGRYGSGKSFLLQTMRGHAMDRGFVVADADLSPERRLMGTKNQGLATYRELIQNLSVKARPEGGALPLILEKWISTIQAKVAASTSFDVEDPAFERAVKAQIFETVDAMEGMVHGFDFARVISLYWEAYRSGDEEIKSKVLRWFRGEYATKTEAKRDLGVQVIIGDEDWYDYIKLFSAFFVKAGYKGLLLMIDELVNIFKIPNAVTRQYNYEKILTMYNDVLQGKARHLGIFMGATPTCIEDTRRGVFSYEALRSRLEEGRFASQTSRDMLAPIIRLQPLSYEEMYVLIERLADIHSQLYGYEKRLAQDDMIGFIKTEFGRIGASQNLTPREIIRDFVELLNILYQNPDKTMGDLMSEKEFPSAASDDQGEEGVSEDYAEFTL